MTPKCYASHPPVPVTCEGRLFGGNGYAPTQKADWYVDLNPRTDVQAHKLYNTKDGGHYTNFPIRNMSVPNLKKLHNLVDGIVSALEQGKSVHVGCIGGHGRTGLVLAVVVKRLEGTLDAVAWLRENYCIKAVESQSQIDYLFDNFGITKVAPRYASKPNWIGDL